MDIMLLQRLQNKVLRYIANVVRYVGMRRLYELSVKSYEYHVANLSTKFYRFTIRGLTLTRNVKTTLYLE